MPLYANAGRLQAQYRYKGHQEVELYKSPDASPCPATVSAHNSWRQYAERNSALWHVDQGKDHGYNIGNHTQRQGCKRQLHSKHPLLQVTSRHGHCMDISARHQGKRRNGDQPPWRSIDFSKHNQQQCQRHILSKVSVGAYGCLQVGVLAMATPCIEATVRIRPARSQSESLRTTNWSGWRPWFTGRRLVQRQQPRMRQLGME